MQGSLKRISSITSFSLVMLILAMLVFSIDDQLKAGSLPEVIFSISHPPIVKYSTHFGYDQSLLKFSLKTSVSPLSSWNTKAIFVGLRVQLMSQNGEVILSQIIHDWPLKNNFYKDTLNYYSIQAHNQISRISIKDKSRSLLRAKLRVYLDCFIQKIVGPATKVTIHQTEYQMPENYSYDEAAIRSKYFNYKKQQ